MMRDARYIGETQYDGTNLHRELRYSDGSATWPGYASNMRLRRGYWLGTAQRHEYLGRRAQALAALRMQGIEVLGEL